jgi:hypothetical protein
MKTAYELNINAKAIQIGNKKTTHRIPVAYFRYNTYFFPGREPEQVF